MPTEPITTETLDAVEQAWPQVLALIREYDEAFPYAEKDGDDESVAAMALALRQLRAERKK